MLVSESGPWNIFVSIRQATGIEHFDDGTPSKWSEGNILACLDCTSVWVSVAMMLLPMPLWAKRALALSSLAIYIERENSK